MVVDDSESIREVMKFTLENYGFDVILGRDGKDALKYLDGRHLDIIITDLHMPEMDGIELITFRKNLLKKQQTILMI